MASSTVSDAHPGPPQIHADLQDVAHEVHREFAHRLDPGQVEECLDRVAAKFDDAKVRSFVPLLVRRYVREELHASLGTPGPGQNTLAAADRHSRYRRDRF